MNQQPVFALVLGSRHHGAPRGASQLRRTRLVVFGGGGHDHPTGGGADGAYDWESLMRCAAGSTEDAGGLVETVAGHARV
jgi:hypothetical protein